MCDKWEGLEQAWREHRELEERESFGTNLREHWESEEKWTQEQLEEIARGLSGKCYPQQQKLGGHCFSPQTGGGEEPPWAYGG